MSCGGRATPCSLVAQVGQEGSGTYESCRGAVDAQDEQTACGSEDIGSALASRQYDRELCWRSCGIWRCVVAQCTCGDGRTGRRKCSGMAVPLQLFSAADPRRADGRQALSVSEAYAVVGGAEFPPPHQFENKSSETNKTKDCRIPASIYPCEVHGAPMQRAISQSR